jgi:hypothetical protein
MAAVLIKWLLKITIPLKQKRYLLYQRYVFTNIFIVRNELLE